ncbi:MAG: type I polyketide synthase, partial [Planctomycetota bacterium]|nr:type I polyketide synthase [Planctomycetota bacterium]
LLQPRRPLPENQPRDVVFLCSGTSTHELQTSLRELDFFEKKTEAGIRETAREWTQSHSPDRSHRLALIANNTPQLHELITQAQSLLEKTPAAAIRHGDPASEWAGRIYYSPKPLVDSGKVAFVYPGSGNHFPGMGRELSVYWPEVFHRQDEETESLRSQLMEDAFWSDRQDVDCESAIFGQVALGTVVTDIIRSYGIEPDAAIGYSLGESAAFFGMRVWRERHEMLKRMKESALFRTEMAGQHNAVRQAWGLSEDEEVDWVVGVVSSPASEVRVAVERIGGRAYLLIVNTPAECVIGGDADSVKELVAALGCGFHEITDVIATHCEVVQPVAQAYRNLHVFETHVPDGVSFYSGVRAGSYEVTSDSAADSILGQALEGFDFTRVIDAAYEDGVRVFIEMGPGTSCS